MPWLVLIFCLLIIPLGMVSVGVVHDSSRIVEEVERLKPDVVVLDLSMPGKDPLEVLTEVAAAHPDTRTIVYSGYDDMKSIDKAVEAGAWGYVSKHEDFKQVIAAKPYCDRVFLAGDVEHAVTLHLIKKADLLLRTTRYDGDAISVREALFLGTPVIATDNGLRPDGVGLIAIGDKQGLIDGIKQIAIMWVGESQVSAANAWAFEAAMLKALRSKRTYGRAATHVVRPQERPDFAYARAKRDAFRAVVLTQGHAVEGVFAQLSNRDHSLNIPGQPGPGGTFKVGGVTDPGTYFLKLQPPPSTGVGLLPPEPREITVERDQAGPRVAAERPENHGVAGQEQDQAPAQRTLTQPALGVDDVDEAATQLRVPLDGPVGQAEDTYLLGGRRIHAKLVGVVDVALLLRHAIGMPDFPQSALPQQHMRGGPSQRDGGSRPRAASGQRGNQRRHDQGSECPFHEALLSLCCVPICVFFLESECKDLFGLRV